MTLSPSDFRGTWYKVEDDSMVESQITFLPGQYIGVDKDAPVAFGDLVVAKRERDAKPVFRRYEPRGFDKQGREIIDLVPLNPDYSTLRIDAENPGHIVGKVVSTLGKCNICHFNAGANADPNIFGPNPGNRNFNTGVEDLPDQPARLTGQRVPADDGLGFPGDGTFNTPPLAEAADIGPFFHNNSVETVEGAVAFDRLPWRRHLQHAAPGRGRRYRAVLPQQLGGDRRGGSGLR
jgi:Peptidase S24-like